MSAETDLIRHIETLIGQPGALRDDTYFDEATRQIMTTDMLVEGRHFECDTFSAEDIGWKAGAVNLSDIAATGGQPTQLLVSLGLPDSAGRKFVTGFYKGLQALCEQSGARIVGGDTVSAPQIIINITAIGLLPAGHSPGRRTTAEPGDWIITTGAHGLSGIGLQALQQRKRGYPQAKLAHRRPTPRLKAGQWLAGQNERYAMMDSSDGLGDALVKIAEASGVRMVIEADRLPHPAELDAFARKHKFNPLDLMLYGGEDFELVATVAEVPISSDWCVIGRVESGQPEACVVDAAWTTVETVDLRKTYQHF